MDINNLAAKMSLEDGPSPSKSAKREDYLSWEDYFMGTALLAAQRSKDPACQVGACIVNSDKRIVGIGYNGLPNGCSDDEFPWTSPEKHLYVCHAEVNAICNTNMLDMKGCEMYVTRFPCNECAKIILQSGIKRIYYKFIKNPDKYDVKASMKMFEAAGVKCMKFQTKLKDIVLDFRNH